MSEIDKSIQDIGKEARAAAKASEEATKNMEAGWKKLMDPIKKVGIA